MHWRDRFILGFCRVEPAGLFPFMPGTCGSLAGALLAPFILIPLPLSARLAALATLFIAGGIASTRAEILLEREDPGEVVIDEVFGQWLVYTPFASLSWPEMAAGFIFFRIFDIVKPWPVNVSERWMPGGYGIMLDDAVAGVYAMACLGLVRCALG